MEKEKKLTMHDSTPSTAKSNYIKPVTEILKGSLRKMAQYVQKNKDKHESKFLVRNRNEKTIKHHL